MHNKPYLYYCNYHKLLCEECEDCDLPKMKRKYDYSHGPCSYGPISNLQLQIKVKSIKEKIENSINFFNAYILKLYNDNKDIFEEYIMRSLKNDYNIKLE